MIEERKVSTTIKKTLLTTLMMDGFWERWIAHGVIRQDLAWIRSSFKSLDTWENNWSSLALEKEAEAKKLESLGQLKEAVYLYRLISLYYNLCQWIYPEQHDNKTKWYNELLRATKHADRLEGVDTVYDKLEIDGNRCEGRVRIPLNTKGVIVMINPIDSSKEELYTYEKDFIENGFITLSFDGPGQGQTYTINGLKASKKRWAAFVNELVNYANSVFPSMPINLFGTSSGGAWSIQGSCHLKVKKAVAVSPATTIKKARAKLPDYFLERLELITEYGESVLPNFDDLNFLNPILLFHGKKDVMVSDAEIDCLYNKIDVNKELIEYDDEGHCCNNQLHDVRKRSMQWFLKKEGEK